MNNIKSLLKHYDMKKKNLLRDEFVKPFAEKLSKYLNGTPYTIKKRDNLRITNLYKIIYKRNDGRIHEVYLHNKNDTLYFVTCPYKEYYDNTYAPEKYTIRLEDLSFEDIVLHIYNLKKLNVISLQPSIILEASLNIGPQGTEYDLRLCYSRSLFDRLNTAKINNKKITIRGNGSSKFTGKVKEVQVDLSHPLGTRTINATIYPIT